MIASLPMYDRAETAAANDRLWTAVRDRLEDVVPDAPKRLSRGGDVWTHWLSPALLLSQTCGLPFRQRLHGQVTLIGTPIYDLEVPKGHYHSLWVVRAGDTREGLADFRDARLAVNQMHSQSGWAAPQVAAKVEAGFVFADILTTGSHVNSAHAVALKAADIACIDAVTWRMMERYDDFTSRLRVIGATQATPALPFITARAELAEALFSALRGAIGDIPASDRATLCLAGLMRISEDDYLAVPSP